MEKHSQSQFRSPDAANGEATGGAGVKLHSVVRACTLLALGLRLYRLDYWGLWVDEGEMLPFASHAPGQLVALGTNWCHP